MKRLKETCCPLMMAARANSVELFADNEATIFCKKECCQWWINESYPIEGGACAIAVIAERSARADTTFFLPKVNKR